MIKPLTKNAQINKGHRLHSALKECKKRKHPSLKTLLTKWAVKVKTRDGYLCRKCHSAGPVEAHHIIHRKHKATRYLMLNGLTLCLKCHPWADTIAGREWVAGEIGDFAYSELRRLEQLDFPQMLQDAGKTEAEWLVDVAESLK